MRKIKIPEYEYENPLGSTTLKNVEVFLDDDEIESLKQGADLESLNYALPGSSIIKAEKTIAFNFFKMYYKDILEGIEELHNDEITSIQDFLGVTNAQFAKILGINKASFSNIIKRGKVSRPVAVLILERLGMELSRRGSARKLVDNNAKLEKPDNKTTREINFIRFGEETAA